MHRKTFLNCWQHRCSPNFYIIRQNSLSLSSSNTMLSVRVQNAMSVPIPTKCKVCTVLHFLYAKGEIIAEIYCQLVSVYGKSIMHRQSGVVSFKKEDIMSIMK